MKCEAVRKINQLGIYPNNVFRLVRIMKIKNTDIEGGNDGTHCLCEKVRAKLWKAHLSKIMNEENEWDQVADADTVEGQLKEC